MAPSEQVAAGLAVGETLQVSATVDGSNPPTGVIVTVDVADEPGATEAGNSVEAERPKSADCTTSGRPDEALPVKLPSPP
jgi:hypothetical protein